MRLHRLELEGFGPFRETQVVDFDAFADDGIFLIAGRTGAGKSSVLDGVCYALFGGVPRYDGTERRLRSDYCAPDDPTRVSLEFTTAGRRLRVTRSPEYERPKLRGGGLTTEPHRALLEEFDGEAWVGIAARPVDVAAQLDEIVGLTQQQFLQVILLAQNRFARFLLARNDERQALLRTLFGTRTYEEYARILEDRRKAAEAAVADEGRTVLLLLDEGERAAREAGLLDDADEAADLPARLAVMVRMADRAAYRVEVAAQERAAAETDLDAVLKHERAGAALHDLHVRRTHAREALQTLEADAPAIDADRVLLTRALAAESLRSVIDAADRAGDAARRAVESSGAASAAWLASGETATTAVELRARDEELTLALTQTAAADDDEAELTVVDAQRGQAERDTDAAVAALDELDARRAAVPALLRSLDERLEVLAGAAAAREAAVEVLAQVRARGDAARAAASLLPAKDAAEREAVAAADRLVAATTAHTALLQRRLESAAGDLARDLVDGEECPVCGATEHPRPAPPSGEPVTDAALEEAEREKDRAIEADRSAAGAARAARESYAAAAARAGGDDLATLEEAETAAQTAVERLEADVSARARLVLDRAELAAIDDEAAAGREALVEEIARHRQTAALAEQRAESLRGRVDAARGAFATVADRRADAERRRARLQTLRETTAETALRAQVLADAVADRDARIAESDFGDSDAARAALLSSAERAALDDRVREHDAAVRANRQSLLDLELALADAPADAVDLESLAAEVATARRAMTEAASTHATWDGLARRLRDLAERADAAHRGIARLAAQHAVVARLADTVSGRAPNTHRMTLETFVLAAELEEIVAAANVRLDEMSAGRYRLQHTDALAARGAASGLGLAVLDAFTGQARPPQSLSGGETFLASLSLALGLAEVVTARAGGLRLDTLFIDEGFGSLDDETLDVAMRVLDELRQGGRTVGVISHVAAMKEQLPAQLLVEASLHGPSTISRSGLSPALART